MAQHSTFLSKTAGNYCRNNNNKNGMDDENGKILSCLYRVKQDVGYLSSVLDPLMDGNKKFNQISQVDPTLIKDVIDIATNFANSMNNGYRNYLMSNFSNIATNKKIIDNRQNKNKNKNEYPTTPLTSHMGSPSGLSKVNYKMEKGFGFDNRTLRNTERNKKRENTEELEFGKKANKESFYVRYSLVHREILTGRKFKGSDLVSDLKQCIQDEQYGGATDLELVHMGKYLMNNKTLGFYGINGMMPVYVIFRTFGGCFVNGTMVCVDKNKNGKWNK